MDYSTLLFVVGQSPLSEKTYKAMSAPVMPSHDQNFIVTKKEITKYLNELYRTNNISFPLVGTGTTAMDATLANIISPGTKVMIISNGFFGERMAEIAQRYKASLTHIRQEWGKEYNYDEIISVARVIKPKILGIVHGETSIGYKTDLEIFSNIAKENESLFIVDASTTLGGIYFDTDKIGIDICFGVSQKCIGCPPGLAPITISQKALNVMNSRDKEGLPFSLDLLQLIADWQGYLYHHTPATSLMYTLHSALQDIIDEGILERCQRHIESSKLLKGGLYTLGFEIKSSNNLETVICTEVPTWATENENAYRSYLSKEYNIWISGGLGQLKNKIWRFGVMGQTAELQTVNEFLDRLEIAIKATNRSLINL